MKHAYRKHHYRRSQRRSSGSSILLVVSWLIAIATACICGHAYLADTKESAPVQEQQVAEVFALQQIPRVKATFQTIRSMKSLRGNEPTILIYHTHTTEAYFPTKQNPYLESSKWRTNDNSKNVVKVGEVLKDILERQYGFKVIHDTTNHEPPKLSTAYERSLVTMQKYHEQYPSICLFIDLHRDAYQDPKEPTDFLEINGTQTARLMLVIGKGEKYTEKPYYEANITLAERMTQYLQSIDPKLARPIRVKPGRYNQHVAPNCILIEVGHNANTLEQAIASMPYFAESIVYAFSKNTDTGIWAPN